MRKKIGVAMLVIATMIGLSACQGFDEGFVPDREINVISREDGSGTRAAFTELTGLMVTDGAGNVTDMTTMEAYIGNGTSIIMGSVGSNFYSIGYVSLGSLNDTVRAMPINGVLPSIATVQDATYPLFRPFNLAVPFEISEAAQDFIDFILSAEGQSVVEGQGYVPVDSNPQAYRRTRGLSGRVVILGSTSIAPVMEHLKEAYETINPGVTVEVQSAGSSAGINAAIQGVADIGMASRDISEGELGELNSLTIAFDGMAVIVNNDNPVTTLSIEEVRQIYAGEITRWVELVQ